MNQLHPGAKWKFRLGAYGAMVVPIIILIYLGNAFLRFIQFANRGPGTTGPVSFSWGGFFIIFGVGLVIFIILSEIYVRLAYSAWKYEFGDASLKLESGVIWKKYSNIPYERIQNIEIHRGIIARMLGFSSLEIHTAGYSGGYHGKRGGGHSEGHIPAVEMAHAEKIREFLMKKISHKSAGGM